ncbi:hypothetical protein K443DRAFT_10056 [Laccaria amethystina LaAM-08-1]|uniref:Uncharacterized protein n=1 Tax=Laccaria amethystina LaAM-08-1 TaxID=1095629 RepID=A0A0C9WLF5_9AGAR|nr:hypothetical protein K443DRAFT_10056 [Laccaria amethystina LaAM-08-1]
MARQRSLLDVPRHLTVVTHTAAATTMMNDDGWEPPRTDPGDDEPRLQVVSMAKPPKAFATCRPGEANAVGTWRMLAKLANE